MRPRGHGAAGKYICGRCRAKIPEDTLERLFQESLAAVELDAAELVAALGTNPRAAEVTRMLGGRAVPLSEIWPDLDPSRRRRLVDQLVAQLVVGTDDISVACPYCYSMLSDAQNELDRENVVTYDVIELVAKSIAG